MTTKPKPSPLLQDHENKAIFQNMGSFCVTLATGVIQLFLADQTDHNRRSKLCCGVAGFLKDNSKGSFFIRVYDIKNCQAGMNFAREGEALKFKKAVDGKLQERNKKRQGAPQPAVPVSQSETYYVDIGCNNINNNMSFFFKKDKKKESKKKLTTADIGAPMDYQHISHVERDPQKQFDLQYLDPIMQQLFQLIGITASEKVDKDTVDFILDCVEKRGGMEAVKRELRSYYVIKKEIPPPPPLPPKGEPAPTWTPKRPQPPVQVDSTITPTTSASNAPDDLVATLSSALQTRRKQMRELEATIVDDWDD